MRGPSPLKRGTPVENVRFSMHSLQICVGGFLSVPECS